MITNNSYLSGLIHRGMRKKLFESFDEIYILNLHGNNRIGERCPDGSKDENVFDIQQGVSIALFIKKEKKSKGCKVFYQDVYGVRDRKYNYLEKSNVHSRDWHELKPTEPYYFFVEKDFSLQAKYDKFTGIPEIFRKSSSGVKTHRDHFVVGFTKEEINQRMRTFTSDVPDEIIRQGLDLKDSQDFGLKDARDKLKKEDWKGSILTYSYRPFDNRYICYRPELIDRDRYDVMQHFLKDNLGLQLKRSRYIKVFEFKHAFAVSNISDINFFGDQTWTFPLYLYQEKKKPSKGFSKTIMMLFEPVAEYEVKKSNLSAEVVDRLAKVYKRIPSPEQIFSYIYSVLYSETYRAKYAEFLKIDFPKVPFTKDYKLFKKMSKYGNRLAGLHLLKSPELDPPVARFRGKGNNRVGKPRYDNPCISPFAKGRKEGFGVLYINEGQYFEGIARDVWSYQIGGYQVCDKWLKDRKERVLSLDEIQTYCRIVTSIQKTIEIQKAIDVVYEEVEKEVI